MNTKINWIDVQKTKPNSPEMLCWALNTNTNKIALAYFKDGKWEQTTSHFLWVSNNTIQAFSQGNEIKPTHWLPVPDVELTITTFAIDKAVATVYKIPVENLRNKKRIRKKMVEPRQTAIYLYYNLLKMSKSEITRSFDFNSHATIINAIKAIENLIDTSASFREKFKIIKNLIVWY